MPTYLYKCKTCGKEFEYFQSITDKALTKCPESVCEQKIKCQGEVFRKISKNVGLVFNGSGFYITDYAKKHHKFSDSRPSKESPAPDSKAEIITKKDKIEST